MSGKKGLVFLLLCLMGVSGCTATNVPESQQSPKQNLSNDAPGFVAEEDFEEVDWEMTAAEFDTNTGSAMSGNENKVGIIGPELKANEIQKWLWHFWGMDEGPLSLVGYHKESKDISPVFSEGVWSRNGIGGGKINGADASLPTNVVLPKAGKWAILVYIDGQLFDTLVIEVNA
ncbi:MULTISPECIES: DUF4871 domain-containing protein [Peribacillus]|uniref:DUF4871 domain-containing protein n=1 Tax=Peribacillus simplex TaxID=1478 RepID=A0A109MZF6_9BACI|nr:DUF4871 domain-containing protein [Peribacillus simplex]KWW20662.1 hypothetical protein AS888_17975 [Peribacillus simplex]